MSWLNRAMAVLKRPGQAAARASTLSYSPRLCRIQKAQRHFVCSTLGHRVGATVKGRGVGGVGEGVALSAQPLAEIVVLVVGAVAFVVTADGEHRVAAENGVVAVEEGVGGSGAIRRDSVQGESRATYRPAWPRTIR